jgi:hypothetical protein
VDDADERGQPVDLREDVAGHKDRHALLTGQARQQVAYLHHAGGVQAVGRLVQHEQLRPVEQGPGQAQTLQVAGRKRAGAAAGVGRDAQLLDDARGGLGSGHALEPPGDLQVLTHGEIGIGGRRLHQVAHTVPGAGAVGAHRLAQHPARSRCRADQASRARMVVVLPAPLSPRKP